MGATERPQLLYSEPQWKDRNRWHDWYEKDGSFIYLYFGTWSIRSRNGACHYSRDALPLLVLPHSGELWDWSEAVDHPPAQGWEVTDPDNDGPQAPTVRV